MEEPYASVTSKLASTYKVLLYLLKPLTKLPRMHTQLAISNFVEGMPQTSLA